MAVHTRNQLKILADGKHNIRDKFEVEVFKVVDKPRPEIPVFRMIGTRSGHE